MQKDDLTWLNVCYVVFGGIVGYILWKSCETLGIQTGYSDRYRDVFPFAATAISLVGAVFGAYWLRKDPERHDYFLASIGEVRKVTWPSADDTKRMTVIVVFVCLVFAAVLAIFDVAWAWALKSILAS